MKKGEFIEKKIDIKTKLGTKQKQNQRFQINSKMFSIFP